jgi:hypothetical protein
MHGPRIYKVTEARSSRAENAIELGTTSAALVEVASARRKGQKVFQNHKASFTVQPRFSYSALYSD